MTWKSYALMSGAGLLATYLASPPLLPQNDTPRAPTAGDGASAPAVDIEEEAARLHARLRAEAVFRAPARDPFRFGERPVRRTPPRTEAPAESTEEAPPAVPEPPFLVLSGIATDIVDGTPQRTAVVTTTSDVLLVRAGDNVGSEYTVRAIAADHVELESTVDGTIRQLHLPVPDAVP